MNEHFWKCPTRGVEKDFLYVLTLIILILSLVLNLGLLVILILLKGRPKLFLFQLRAIVASALFSSSTRFCNIVLPFGFFHGDHIFAPVMCHLWSTVFFSFATYTFTDLVVNFMVGNRAIQIVCRYQYSHSTSAVANLAYLVGLGLVSILLNIPQSFAMQWDGEQCNCLETGLSYEMLVSMYTRVYVRFGLSVIVSGVILGISCYVIIYWVRNTPAEKLTDTWNIVYLPGTTKEQMGAFSKPQGWMTATLCTIPLSVNFVVFSIYRTGYNFICAVGLCTVNVESPFFKIEYLLTELQVLLLPIIIMVYIPALRELPVRVWKKVISIRQRYCNNRRRVEDECSRLDLHLP